MLEKIKEIVAGFMGICVSDVLEEKNFLEMGMDSLTLLKIIIDTEKLFNVRFGNEEIVEIRTVLDILGLVEKKILDN